MTYVHVELNENIVFDTNYKITCFVYISTGKGDEIEHSQLGYDHNSCAESFRSLLVGGPKASPIQLYPVNVSQLMLLISGDVEPNPGPNPRFVKDIVVKS